MSTGSGREETSSALRFLGELLLKYLPVASFDLDLGVAALKAGTAAAEMTYALTVVGLVVEVLLEELVLAAVVASSSRSFS